MLIKRLKGNGVFIYVLIVYQQLSCVRFMCEYSTVVTRLTDL